MFGEDEKDGWSIKEIPFFNTETQIQVITAVARVLAGPFQILFEKIHQKAVEKGVKDSRGYIPLGWRKH